MMLPNLIRPARHHLRAWLACRSRRCARAPIGVAVDSFIVRRSHHRFHRDTSSQVLFRLPRVADLSGQYESRDVKLRRLAAQRAAHSGVLPISTPASKTSRSTLLKTGSTQSTFHLACRQDDNRGCRARDRASEHAAAGFFVPEISVSRSGKVIERLVSPCVFAHPRAIWRTLFTRRPLRTPTSPDDRIAAQIHRGVGVARRTDPARRAGRAVAMDRFHR